MTARVEGVALRRSEGTTRIRTYSRVARFRAPFSLRCGAILIDYILLVAIVAFSTLIARMFGGAARSAGSSAETLGFVIAIAAALLDLGVLAGLTGQTVGKWATGLRIERIDNEDLSIGRAILRHFVGYPLSFVSLGLGFLIAAVDSRGRTLHDIIAGTLVVRETSDSASWQKPTVVKPQISDSRSEISDLRSEITDLKGADLR
jgi:uncharacterized RDD family membrane protein YckC